jgi:hypothetical protein
MPYYYLVHTGLSQVLCDLHRWLWVEGKGGERERERLKIKN